MKEEYTRLKDLNQQFLKGADEIWFTTPRGYWIDYNKLDTPVDFEYYTILRTIQYRSPKKIMFVFDIDFSSDRKRAIALGKLLMDKYPDTFAEKFSGNGGPHLISNMVECPKFLKEIAPYPKVYDYMKAVQVKLLEEAGLIVAERTKDVKSKIDNPKLVCIKPQTRKKIKDIFNKDIPMIDGKMFERRRRFRAFSIHHKTELFSVPIDPDDDVETVNLKASLQILPPKKFTIPDFNLYEMHEPNGFIEHHFECNIKDVKLPNGFENDYERIRKVIPYPCVAFDLASHKINKESHHGPTHFTRYFTVHYLKSLGWSPQMVYTFMKSLEYPDFKSGKTIDRINYEFDRNFYKTFEQPLYRICRKIADEGLCLGKNCDEYERVRKTWRIEQGA